MSRLFADKSRERLLFPKGYSNSGYFSESGSTIEHNDSSVFDRIKKWWIGVLLVVVDAYKLDRSDPRKLKFGVKSGLAFGIVSILTYVTEPVQLISENIIWAILTVILIFEFNVETHPYVFLNSPFKSCTQQSFFTITTIHTSNHHTHLSIFSIIKSISQIFTNRSKERLLSRKGYSESGFFSESHIVINSNNNEDASVLDRIKKRCSDVRLFVVGVVEMGRSDPLQIIFAAKSGLALAIVCVLVLFKDSVSYLSEYAIWGILTVIVVFEFTAGKLC